ncbi:diacylglycerol kinase family protein [Ornithinimicrobium humiphilum]|uniref:Diacylglycerol kinase family enzyme n=1 Tax=Ornithinimicrobium humiphilum TaxID=125288 RepID=A0A543KNE2_9MICO|nr:diacylglycerol kinase family protein [Ornithinimicrobium humiphilum]TQM96591.1 diacylglycerol kinase family enzyme [Ornithinimicrobium humiphilum]
MAPTPRVALVVNPVSRASATAVEAVTHASRDAGLGNPWILPTTVEQPGGAQARQAREAGVERVVVAGGDGTVRLVAGVLGERSPDDGDDARVGPARPTLGVVPTGTANLFARSALLPVADVRRAARLAVTGAGRPTDLGHARFEGPGGEAADHPFLVLAGLGHDAATLAAVRPSAKAGLRWLAYLLPGLGRLGSPGHALRLALDGEPVDAGPLWSLLAVNAARLPAGMRVVPGASLDDGELHTVLVSPRNLADWARIAATGTGRVAPHDHPALRYRSGRTLVVESPEPVLAQVDGDVVPDIVRARVTVLAGALNVAR